jgi:AAA15 family ATPase/GTPase
MAIKLGEKIFRRFYELRFGAQNSTPELNATKTTDEFEMYLEDEGIENVDPNVSSVYRWMKSIEKEIAKSGSMTTEQQIIDDERTSASVSNGAVVDPEDVELKIGKLKDEVFPDFKLWKSGTCVDRICSDFTEEGGLYSSTVNVITGESGVGKSTFLIDLLVKFVEANHEELKLDDTKTLEEQGIDPKDVLNPVFISTEMTRNDMQFYSMKMPKIKEINTMFASDYLGQGFKAALEKVFLQEDHQIIILDSYQDTVEKLKDDYNWTSTKAEQFLVQLMTKSAEERGVAIFAVQHMTKGGQYVGKTYLKHATTAMMEIRFDGAGERYVIYSKNRRGGSMTHTPIFFYFKKGEDELSYDKKRFEMLVNSEFQSKSEDEKREELDNKFNSIFSAVPDGADEDEEVKEALEEGEEVKQQTEE